MSRPIVDNSDTLAGVVTQLGGTMVPASTFRFDLPLSEVRTVVPKLNQLGVGVRKISERVEENPTKLFSPMTVATLELYRPERQDTSRLPETNDFRQW
jgi:hypothetical protein